LYVGQVSTFEMPSVLFVFTSADTNLKGGPTACSLLSHAMFLWFTSLQGWFLPEAAHPYYLLKDVAKVDFAAPKGPNPPLDPLSVKVSCFITRVFDDQEIRTNKW